MMRRVLLAAALLGALGCSTLLGIDGDYIEQGSMADGSAPFDGAADVAETGVVGDGASPDAPPPTFCTTWDAGDALEVFCDDFDQGKPVGWGWNGTWAPDGGSIALDEDGGLSPPRSLELVTQGSGNATVWLKRTMPPASKRAAAQVDVRIDDWAQASGPSFSLLSIENTSPEAIFIIVGPTSATLWEAKGTNSATQTDTPLTTFPIKGAWTRLRIEVDLTAQTVTTFLDGKQSNKHALTYAWPLDAGLEMYAGSTSSYAANVGKRRFHLDNAILERH